MEMKKKDAIMACESFDELLNAEYGERGTEEREKFEVDAEAFCLAECLKEQRRLAGLTQEQLAAKIGTKKSYISKIENGHADIQFSTLFRISTATNMSICNAIIWITNPYTLCGWIANPAEPKFIIKRLSRLHSAYNFKEVLGIHLF